MKTDFGLGPNGPRAGLGKIPKFRPALTSGVLDFWVVITGLNSARTTIYLL
jgi:hypothetical protein